MTEFARQGLGYTIALGLALVVIWLGKRYLAELARTIVALRAERDKWQAEYTSVQEKRLELVRETRKEIAELTAKVTEANAANLVNSAKMVDVFSRVLSGRKED